DMNIRRTLVEGVPRLQRNGRLALQLHHDLTFEHIDERVGVVSMNDVLRTGRIRHLDHASFLARAVCEICREQFLYVRGRGWDGYEHQESRRQVSEEAYPRLVHVWCLSQ